VDRKGWNLHTVQFFEKWIDIRVIQFEFPASSNFIIVQLPMSDEIAALPAQIPLVQGRQGRICGQKLAGNTCLNA
jgi:hypothetical protein